MSNLLEIQGTSNTPAHGHATIISSPTSATISHNWRILNWTDLTKIRNYTQQNNNKGLHCCFVCFANRALHIEVVTSLTTETFLAALGRFIARQGKPRTIYSDKGTNFQGAANQIHEFYNILQSSLEMAKVQDFLANEGCDWKFIPQHGPHFGELWVQQ